MANIHKDFNQLEADKIFNKYNSLSRFDPLVKTRETKAVYFRALLYKVLIDFNYMNDRQVVDYFLTKGKKMNRVSVLQAVRKIDIYYRDFADFRQLYDVYFGDKIEESKVIKQSQKDKIKNLNRKLAQSLPNYKKDALELFIDTIPASRRAEMLEFAQYRAQSWAWKTADRCEIIESCCSVTESTF